MTSRDFCYWLQGYFELTGNNIVSENQVQCIKNHLNLVFKHEIDPSIDLNNPEIKTELQKIHDGIIQSKPFVLNSEVSGNSPVNIDFDKFKDVKLRC
jgi:hypothetical protein